MGKHDKRDCPPEKEKKNNSHLIEEQKMTVPEDGEKL